LAGLPGELQNDVPRHLRVHGTGSRGRLRLILLLPVCDRAGLKIVSLRMIILCQYLCSITNRNAARSVTSCGLPWRRSGGNRASARPLRDINRHQSGPWQSRFTVRDDVTYKRPGRPGGPWLMANW
jgi:hypothetical protein